MLETYLCPYLNSTKCCSSCPRKAIFTKCKYGESDPIESRWIRPYITDKQPVIFFNKKIYPHYKTQKLYTYDKQKREWNYKNSFIAFFSIIIFILGILIGLAIGVVM